MSDEKHEGWTNFETWTINIELTQDQGLQKATYAIIAQNFEYEIERDDALRDFVDRLIEDNIINPRISLHRVNWKELVEVYKRKIKEDVEYIAKNSIK